MIMGGSGGAIILITFMNRYIMKLSRNFSLAELIKSDTAIT